MAAQTVIAQESLNRAVTSQSVMNYQQIFEGFLAMGIPENEIKPRENVFTFWAWKALGRRVKKGEHGVKAVTFVPVNGKDKKDEQTGEVKKTAGFRMPRTTTVFHISQTEIDPHSPTLQADEEPAHIEEPHPKLTIVPKMVQPSPLIARFRSWADALQPKIDYAFRDMTQNPTPKRNREYQSRRHDGRNMERTQKALRALADAHENGTISPELAELKTREDIGRLVRKSVSGAGGYYSVIECDDYSNTTPTARILQDMIEGNQAQRAEQERLRRIDELKAAIALSDIPGYFPTQPPVIEVMIDRAKIENGNTMLEPEAGSGHIADALRDVFPLNLLHCVEPNSRLRELLTLKGHTLIESDLMEVQGRRYDRIIMNPPFERQQDIDHVRKAYSLLNHGGVMVSVMAPGFEFRQDRKSVEFRQWLEDVGATVEDLPEGSFKASGTGVNTKLVIIEM